VNQHSATPDFVTNKQQAGNHVSKKGRTKAVPFVLDVDTQPCKEGDWLWVLSGSLLKTVRRIDEFKLSHSPGVIRDDSARLGIYDDKDLRNIRGSRLFRVSLEPERLFR
jgi:hypothetical protein